MRVLSLASEHGGAESGRARAYVEAYITVSIFCFYTYLTFYIQSEAIRGLSFSLASSAFVVLVVSAVVGFFLLYLLQRN